MAKKVSGKLIFQKALLNYGLYAAMLMIIIVFGILNPNFLTFNNVFNILEQSAYFIVVAVGATFPLIIGEQDLSVGGVLAGLTILGATVMKSHGIFIGLLAMFGAAIIIGLINGSLVTLLKLPSFIATIAIGYIVRGLGAYYTNGAAVSGLPKELTRFVWNKIMGIPALLFIAIIAVLVAVYILNFTKFGRTVYSYGANKVATKMMGIRTSVTGISSYVICSILCCLAAVMVMARSSVARFGTLPSLQMECIAAAVIGGTSLSGGRGNLLGTAIGAILLILVQSGLNALGVSAFWQEVFTGVIIIASISLDSYKTRHNG